MKIFKVSEPLPSQRSSKNECIDRLTLPSQVIYTSVRRGQGKGCSLGSSCLFTHCLIPEERNFPWSARQSYEHREYKTSPAYRHQVHSSLAPYSKEPCGIGTAKLAHPTGPHVGKLSAPSWSLSLPFCTERSGILLYLEANTCQA